MSSSDTSNTRPDNVINASPFSCRHLSWAERKLNVKFIHQQPQTADSGGRSEALWLPEWEQEWRPKREECNSASCHPPNRGSGGEKSWERRARLFSLSAGVQKAQPGSSGHVSTSCPRKTNRAVCRAPGEFIHAPSAGHSFFQRKYSYYVDVLQRQRQWCLFYLKAAEEIRRGKHTNIVSLLETAELNTILLFFVGGFYLVKMITNR